MKKEIEQIKNFIAESETIALFSHMNPDGDAIGSVMAMKNYLDNLGKKTYVFLPEPISETFEYLGVLKFANKERLKEYDLAICLDAPNTKRFGEFETEYFKAKKSIKIDHHIVEDNYGTINVVDEEISSACELLYCVLKDLNVEITPQIATCLYTGIATDTGGFLHGNHGEVTPKTWRTVAELTEYGADLKTINYNVFIRLKRNVFELYKEILSRVEFFEDGKIAIVCLPKSLLEKTQTDLNDTHKFIGIIGGIDGVEISGFMTELKKNEIAVSVRSQLHNAQRVCKRFGGGGHLKAAGCRLFTNFSVAKMMLIEEFECELKRND